MSKRRFADMTPFEREQAREVRKLRQHLASLVSVSRATIAQIDMLMKLPSTIERGGRIALLLNELEMETDKARHFGLGEKL